jgi:hypothetical protein
MGLKIVNTTDHMRLPIPNVEGLGITDMDDHPSAYAMDIYAKVVAAVFNMLHRRATTRVRVVPPHRGGFGAGTVLRLGTSSRGVHAPPQLS